MIEKKNLIEIDCRCKNKWFLCHLISFYKKSLYKMFFSLELAWNDRFEPEKKKSSFELIVGFGTNSLVFKN